MKRTLVASALLLCSIAVATPARADFQDIVRAIEQKGDVHRAWIPFFWIGRLAVRMHAVEGVSDIQLATFEKNRLSVSDLDTIVRSNRQERWQPIVVATSSRDREQTYIYSRPDKDQLQLLIVARDREDTTVVQLRIEPKMFLETVQHPGRARGQFSF